MNGSVAFLAIKRDLDFIVEANLDAVGFMGIHCTKIILVVSGSLCLILYADC